MYERLEINAPNQLGQTTSKRLDVALNKLKNSFEKFKGAVLDTGTENHSLGLKKLAPAAKSTTCALRRRNINGDSPSETNWLTPRDAFSL